MIALPESAIDAELVPDDNYASIAAAPEPEVLDAEPLQLAEVRSLSLYRAARQRRLDQTRRPDSELIAQAQNGDEAAMERLWLDSQKLAEMVANSRRQSKLPVEDMIQIALEVVPGTIRRYDGDTGVPLEAFLLQRMKGAIIDAERQLGRADGLSRNDYEKLQDALESDDPDASLHALTQPKRTSAGRLVPGFVDAPQLVANGTVSTTAKSLDSPVHLSGSNGDQEVAGGTEVASSHDVYVEAQQNIENDRLRAAIAELPEQERLAITHYHGLTGTSLTLREIGEQVLGGVTESRASQIHSSAVKRLGRLLSGQEDPDAQANRFKKPPSLDHSEIKESISAELAGISEAVVLSEEEISTVLGYIPAWERRPVRVGDEDYQLLLRNASGLGPDDPLIAEQQDRKRRAVGLKNGSIMIMTKELRAPDLLLALDIEEQLAGGLQEPLEGDDFKERLAKRQYEAVSMLYMTNDEIAAELGISEAAVRSLIHRAMRTLELDSIEDLAVSAARKGVIPLDKIPAGKTAGLTPRQYQLVKGCYNMTRNEAAETLELSPNTVRYYRHNIYTRTGAKNSVQVALMAFKDGLIPSRQEESREPIAVTMDS